MNLYQVNKSQLQVLKENPFKLEREIQNLFEQNLNLLTGLEFVKSEFTIKGKRIDTLAYDIQSNAFIIIEYKRDKNVSVVDQGFTYLGLMLENKADFVLTYNETLNKNLHSSKVDWSQTRVVFVSPSFTENQRLQASIHQNFGRAILHAGLPMDTKEDNSTITNLDYKWVNKGTIFKGLSAKAYYSFVNHIMDNSRRLTFETSENIADVEATTYGGKIESEWNFIEKWKLFAGADMVNLSRDGGRDRLAKRNMAGVLLPIPIAYYDKLWQDSYNNTVGTFVEAKWFASQKSIFSFGARVEFVASVGKYLCDKF